jgi:hypothetical protein
LAGASSVVIPRHGRASQRALSPCGEEAMVRANERPAIGPGPPYRFANDWILEP